MGTRRQFLTGLLATGIAPLPSWADAGSPAFLSAARRQDGHYILCGIDAAHDVLFQIPLPDRGHAAAAHPIRPEAVAFARRPGTFAIVINCVTGLETARLASPPGRHFYGHGAFSRNGDWLYTTESDYAAGTGRIAVWDVANGYRRAGDFPSGGIGPHEIRRQPGTDTLVIANGGIDTHPDSGRTKLNIPTMDPNLSYAENGTIVETARLDPDLSKNSIRHIAVSMDGTVAMGMQWQGEDTPPAMVATHARGASQITLLTAAQQDLRNLQGYIGSIAFDPKDRTVVATSPRGGVVHRYDPEDGFLIDSRRLPDVSGVAPQQSGVVVSTGAGQLIALDKSGQRITTLHDLQWDNHLISLS